MCPIAEMTRSKLSSSNGSDWASPSSHSISTMASAPRSRAITIRPGERSRPVTRAPSLAAGIVALPVPHATSSTSIPDSMRALDTRTSPMDVTLSATAL